MTESETQRNEKPATAARIYDYLLGGVHNFPADREAAQVVIASLPDVRLAARSNRTFLQRAVRHFASAGIRQFLDIGSGIPTQGNVHEIAQDAAPGSRVVYADIDPIAVADSLEMLQGNSQATAIRANLANPREVLDHPAMHKMLDLSQPTALLLMSVLPFIPDDATAYGSVKQLVDALAPGSFLALTHGGTESLDQQGESARNLNDVYREKTATPVGGRTRVQVERFFDGMEILEPGVVWAPAWRPVDDGTDPLIGEPARSVIWAAAGRKP